MKTSILLLSLLMTGAAHASSLDDYRRALYRVQGSLRALGSDRIDAAGGLTVRCRGWRDLNARFQGQDPTATERVPLEETLVFSAADGALSWRVDSRVNADAHERMRYDYATEGDGDDGLLIVDLLNRRAFRDSGAAVVQQRVRQSRAIPDLLLVDVLAERATLRAAGASGDGERVDVTLDGETLSLYFDPAAQYLKSVEYLLDLPLQGDALVRWVYEGWRTVTGLGPYPAGYRIEINDRTYKSVECDTVRPGVNPALAALPDDIPIPEAPAAAGDGETPPPADPPLPEPRELADGVWLVPNIRSGFHPLLVAFDDFSVVVDAPSGWYELDQLPAYNWAAGETASSVGERLLAVAREQLPDRPLKYLVLTHWHSDHAGGLRPLVEAGVTLVAAPETLAVAERALARTHSLVPDALAGHPVEPERIAVTNRHVIEGGGRALELINVGDNPHAKGMLVAWLPTERILYQSDLFEPLPERFFPSTERMPVMRWFVNWLDASGLEPERIYAIHGTARVTDEQWTQVRNEASGEPRENPEHE